MSRLLLESGDALLAESGDALADEAPATAFSLLLESGDRLLRESGDALLMEDAGETGPSSSGYLALSNGGGGYLVLRRT